MKFTGPAWIVFPWRDYQDFLLYDSFMEIDLGDSWFMNVWASPAEALCFRAYGEASCHQFPPGIQYVVMCLHIVKENIIRDSKIPKNPKTAFFQRYGGGNDSLVFNMGWLFIRRGSSFLQSAWESFEMRYFARVPSTTST
jgi:hypothetical protein